MSLLLKRQLSSQFTCGKGSVIDVSEDSSCDTLLKRQ